MLLSKCLVVFRVNLKRKVCLMCRNRDIIKRKIYEKFMLFYFLESSFLECFNDLK